MSLAAREGAEVSLVRDASVAAGLLLPDETPPAHLAASIDAATGRLHAPWLLWAELRNVLLLAERRRRLPEGAAEAFLPLADRLDFAFDTAPDSAAVLRLARAHRLSAYDALYLELALRRRATLATLDAALRQAAGAEGVPLV